MDRVRIELVTRAGCHLCGDVERLLAEEGIDVTVLDVDSDQELFDRYDFRVPVLLVEGEPALEGMITRATVAGLRARLSARPDAP